jgi:GntR family transcriptional regulator, transcriptional repressor for pyruvate dehydrogenase complex
MRNQIQPGFDTDLNSLVEQLRRRLAAGEPLPAERAIAEQYAVKRHKVRQALAQLRELGDLEQTRRMNAAGGESLIRATNPLEVIELRLALEPALARLAAVRATPLEIARIVRAATTPPDMQRSTADLAFHKLVAAASGNALAADLYSLLRKFGCACTGAKRRAHLPEPPGTARSGAPRSSRSHLRARPGTRRGGDARPPQYGAPPDIEPPDRSQRRLAGR